MLLGRRLSHLLREASQREVRLLSQHQASSTQFLNSGSEIQETQQSIATLAKGYHRACHALHSFQSPQPSVNCPACCFANHSQGVTVDRQQARLGNVQPTATFTSQSPATDSQLQPQPPAAVANQLVAQMANGPPDGAPSLRRIFILDDDAEWLDPGWTISQAAWTMASKITSPEPSARPSRKQQDPADSTTQPALAPAAKAAAHEKAALQEDFLAETAWSHTFNEKPR